LEFKREAEQGSQSEFSLAYQNQKKIVQNTPARFISTRKYIQSEFCLANQNQKKNRSKYAGPIYFHAQVYPE